MCGKPRNVAQVLTAVEVAQTRFLAQALAATRVRNPRKSHNTSHRDCPPTNTSKHSGREPITSTHVQNVQLVPLTARSQDPLPRDGAEGPFYDSGKGPISR